MPENIQNEQKPAGNDQNTQKNGSGHHHRRRPHKYHNRPHQEAAKKADTLPTDVAEATEKTNQSPQATDQPSQKPNHASRKNKGGNDQRKNRHEGNNRNRQRDNGSQHRANEKRPYDPYEQPNKEEIALSELRAQIVLKAADGTVPTAYGSQPAPTQSSQTETPQAVSETEPTENVAEQDILSTSAMPDTTPEEPVAQVEVIGVRFQSTGKTYYFDPRGMQAKKGDFAVVETTRGIEFGEISLSNRMINANDTIAPLRPLIRIATKEDIQHHAENKEKEKQALVICQEKIREHGLEMKLIDVQYAFDNTKLLFYFSAEGRVDFRELVRDLASVFRTRIELRQIGIRDEAKMLGGIGACGRMLCCSTFLPDFAQVSIKMAKEQNLSLNSAKISGVCGRLMCCLRYESDVYNEEIRRTPANESTVRTPDGVGTVISSNPLAGTVRVLLKDSPDTAPKQYHRDEVTLLPKEKKGSGESRDHEKKKKEENT